MNAIGGLMAIWLLVLGMAFVLRGERGARWWRRMTQRFLGWVVREALVAIGNATLWTVRNGHAYFHSRWPQQTLIAYGVSALIVIFLLLR